LQDSVCLSPGLFKDTHDLRLKFPKFHGQGNAARMKDQIAAGGEQVDVTTQIFANAALDAITLVRLSKHFARSQANARQ